MDCKEIKGEEARRVEKTEHIMHEMKAIYPEFAVVELENGLYCEEKEKMRRVHGGRSNVFIQMRRSEISEVAPWRMRLMRDEHNQITAQIKCPWHENDGGWLRERRDWGWIATTQDTWSMLPLECRLHFIMGSVGLPRPLEGAKVVSLGEVLRHWSWSHVIWWC